MTQKIVVHVSRDDFAGYQAVLTETVDRFIVPALEKKVAVFNEVAIDVFCGECFQVVDNRLAAAAQARRCGKAGSEYLRRFRIADRENARAIDIAAGMVARRAHETEVILPTHWRHHVFRRQVQ